MMAHLVIMPLLLPLLAGIVLLLLRTGSIAPRRAVSFAASAGLVAIAALLISATGNGDVLTYRLGDWQAPFGIVLVADRLAAIMVMVTALLSAAVMLHAVRGGDRSATYFHVLFQLQLFGLNGAFLTGDLFNLFVFFEVLLIASYGLLLQGGGPQRTRAGLHYVVLNLIGSTLFLFAVGALYGVLGTLNMADLAQKIAVASDEDIGTIRAAGLLLFVVFGLKAALAPLHLWLPGAYGHASLTVAAMFAIMTKVGAYSIVRVYSLVFGDSAGAAGGLIDPWLMPLALLTVVAGTIGMLASRHLAQQAANLVVMSAGTLLMAFGLGGTTAVAAGLYYLAHTTFAAAALFLLTDVIARCRGRTGDLLVAGPALPRAQLLGGLFLVVAVAVAGMPPLSGFFGKLLVLQATLDTPWIGWVFSIVLITSLFSIMALARSGSRLFFKIDDMANSGSSPGNADLAGPVALLAAGIALVVFAEPVHDFFSLAAQQLAQPDAYLAAVLPVNGSGVMQ